MHDLGYFNGLSLQDQENTFGRTKADSTKLAGAGAHVAPLSHVELREGETADESTPKRGEMVRRSTPYAFHDGTVGLYFMGFCREQAPMRERMEAIYGTTARRATRSPTTRRRRRARTTSPLGGDPRRSAHLTGRRQESEIPRPWAICATGFSRSRASSTAR